MNQRDRFELLLLGAIWGASFLFMRIAVPEFGALALVEIRVAVAALFLAALLAWRGGFGALRRVIAPIAVLGFFSSALPFALFAYATHHVTAGTAAVLNATAPLFGALVAYVWLKDGMTSRRAYGLALGFGGVLLLVWDKMSFGGGDITLAIVAGLSASLCYGVAANFIKKKLSGVPPMAVTTGNLIAASLMLLPLSATHWPAVAPSLKSWLSVIALGILCTGVALYLYFRLIARIGPARAIAVNYLIPMFGMLWGLLFLHEAVTVSMVGACAIILLGTALASGSTSTTARRATDSSEASRA
jgi:drug/metabolite transporter (DMT)-like permease